MGAQSTAQNEDLLLQGHWGKEDAAVELVEPSEFRSCVKVEVAVLGSSP